ncbi:hypothetical protein HWV62_40374 [Athelia sp. TMB]|nr:hypothetical protein HWV62_40374 [Athelia sp. TMB]
MRVNMPSILYSVFFASNSNLNKMFPDMDETHTYTKSFACKVDVNARIRSNTPEMARAGAKLPIREQVPFAQKCDLLISTVDRIINPDPCNVFGVQSFITRDPKVRSPSGRSDAQRMTWLQPFFTLFRSGSSNTLLSGSTFRVHKLHRPHFLVPPRPPALSVYPNHAEQRNDYERDWYKQEASRIDHVAAIRKHSVAIQPVQDKVGAHPRRQQRAEVAAPEGHGQGRRTRRRYSAGVEPVGPVVTAIILGAERCAARTWLA